LEQKLRLVNQVRKASWQHWPTSHINVVLVTKKQVESCPFFNGDKFVCTNLLEAVLNARQSMADHFMLSRIFRDLENLFELFTVRLEKIDGKRIAEADTFHTRDSLTERA
jgi:hypothetical protein